MKLTFLKESLLIGRLRPGCRSYGQIWSCRMAEESKQKGRAIAFECLKKLLRSFADRQIELSGGQQQRVFLARPWHRK